jgi:hypothetical protein
MIEVKVLQPIPHLDSATERGGGGKPSNWEFRLVTNLDVDASESAIETYCVSVRWFLNMAVDEAILRGVKVATKIVEVESANNLGILPRYSDFTLQVSAAADG